MKITDGIYLVGGGDIGLSNKMDCHVYLLDGGEKKCLIDSGIGLQSRIILENIKEEGFDPKNDLDYLLISHAHADHAGGAKDIYSETGAEVIAPQGEAQFIEKGGKDLDEGLRACIRAGVYPTNYKYRHVNVRRTVRHNTRLKVGKYHLRVIQIPGHSHATAGFLIEEEPRCFFSSDIVFVQGTIGLGNWPGCSLDNYRKYIDRLGGLRVVSLFPGHYIWTLVDGQSHLDTAISNMSSPWVPPSWGHNHPLR
jgi:glyoxylase-like metal-dependent hydrolase (beta-lactamase superfamily II)